MGKKTRKSAMLLQRMRTIHLKVTSSKDIQLLEVFTYHTHVHKKHAHKIHTHTTEYFKSGTAGNSAEI